jgi:hypothetical protein
MRERALEGYLPPFLEILSLKQLGVERQLTLNL